VQHTTRAGCTCTPSFRALVWPMATDSGVLLEPRHWLLLLHLLRLRVFFSSSYAGRIGHRWPRGGEVGSSFTSGLTLRMMKPRASTAGLAKATPLSRFLALRSLIPPSPPPCVSYRSMNIHVDPSTLNFL
jgi:hypothetical protein